MTALLTTANWDSNHWLDEFAHAAPERTVYVNGVHTYEPADVLYALTWKPPEGLLRTLPNLKVIFNLGAGVDALLSDTDLPDVPIVRLVDDNLTWRMGEWVTLQVLTHHRQALHYLAQQKAHQYKDQSLRHVKASELTVGMMGYGVLGQHCAGILQAIGYEVIAWSRSAKDGGNVPVYAGEEEKAAFLAKTDILVVLLPFTPATYEILNADLFAALSQDSPLGGPVIINGGRGGLQNEDDVVAALKSGALAGASLDVFKTEPLPADSPLWDAPNLVLTPHVAAISEPRAVARYVVAQMDAFERGDPMTNIVDRHRGY